MSTLHHSHFRRETESPGRSPVQGPIHVKVVVSVSLLSTTVGLAEWGRRALSHVARLALHPRWTLHVINEEFILAGSASSEPSFTDSPRPS